MSYKLFIDDERFPVEEDAWVIARSTEEAKWIVEAYGMPQEIAFDHDLGGDDTSIKFINWMITNIVDGELKIPSSFSYSVHSQNPVGAANIKFKMDAIVKLYKGTNMRMYCEDESK